MINILNEIYAKEKIVCIYTNKKDTEKFYIGTIKKILSNKLLFESMNLDGEIDGFMVVYIEDIYLIEVDNLYIDDMIHKRGNQIKSENYYIPEISGDLLIDFIHNIISMKTVVEIELNNSSSVDIRGQIRTIIDKYIEVDSLNDNDECDGRAYCRVNDISMIWVYSNK